MELDEAGRLEIVDTFGRLLDAHCPRGAGAGHIGREDGKLWDALATGGWIDMGADEAAGGTGLSLADLSLLAVEWGRRLPPLPFATSALARRWGVHGAVGDTKVTFALPHDEGVLVPFGASPDVTLEGALQSNVEADDFSPALPVSRGKGEPALDGERLAELQILYCGEAIGAAQEAFDRAIAYSQERIAYGRPVSAFQAMRHFMADMHVDLELAKTALFWALNVTGEERSRALESAVESCRKVTSDAIQVFGGIGFTWDFGAHLYLRHVMAATEIVKLKRRPQ